MKWIIFVVLMVGLLGSLPLRAFPLSGEELFEQAWQARAQGDYRTALELFERCVAENVRVHDAYYEMGLILLERGEYRRAFTVSGKAISAFRNHLEQNPDDHWSFFRLGYIHEVRSEAPSVREWQEAEEAMRKALELSPGNPLYLLHLGFVYYRKKEYDQAEKTLREAVSVHPTDVEIRYWLATVLKAQEKSEEAKEEFRFVIENAPPENRYLQWAKRDLARLERKES